MLRIERHGDVVRLIMSSVTSRAAGYQVSAYLVDGVLVDCGFPAVRRSLRRLLRERPIAGVMVTHAHEDHAGNVGLLAQLGVPVAAGEDTLRILREAPSIELYRRIVWGQPGSAMLQKAQLVAPHLRLVPTPGHSRDHHVVWDDERNTVFGGDLFVGVRVRVAHEDENPREQVRSLRSVAAMKPERVFDGHRGPIDDPAASLEAKAAWMEDIIGRVESLIAAGVDDRSIARQVLGREEAVYYFSAGHYSHINFVRAVRREGMAAAATSAAPIEQHGSLN